MLSQADKDLIIKDLCGKLPYGVKCETYKGALPIYTIAYDGSVLFKDGNNQFCIDSPRPYLRSIRNKHMIYKLLHLFMLILRHFLDY